MDMEVFDQLLSWPLDTLQQCRGELGDVRRARAKLDAREAVVMTRLDELSRGSVAVSPEHEHADANRGTASQGAKAGRRAKTANETMPSLGEAMAAGDVSGESVDVIANALASLATQAERDAFTEFEPQLRRAAATLSKAELAKTVEMYLRRVRVDECDRLERQRQQSRLRWSTDRLSGMWRLTGLFDPERGAVLQAMIETRREQLFHGKTPPDAPIDHFDRQEFLNANAFVDLITNAPAEVADRDVDSIGFGPTPRVDMSVTIDAETLLDGSHEDTVCDLDLDSLGLPIETIRRWACVATITPVVVAEGGQRIHLGRTVDLANRAQRRALFHFYTTCALCPTPFRHCEIHHVTWRSRNGLTDIENLIPICVRHHHLVHEGGWALHLAPDRTLTVTRPDGTTDTHQLPIVRTPATQRTRPRARPPTQAA